MLHEFLTANRPALIASCRAKVAHRRGPSASGVELEYGIPLFLDQLIKTLQVEQTTEPMLSRRVSGPSGGGQPALSEIGIGASRHGRELLQRGFTIDQVVHDYGDLCQAVTELASVQRVDVGVDEFCTLNRCVDNAIADAVTEFAYQRDVLTADREVQSIGERLGSLAHELRNLVHTATLAVTAIKAGSVGVGGPTGGLLDRALIGMQRLIDRSLCEVRVTVGMPARHTRMSLAEFIAEMKIAASLEAQAVGCGLIVSAVDTDLAVDADRDLLFSAVGNLLHNAFKFTKAGTEVSLSAYASADRVLIEVEDHCGGLPTGAVDTMFKPFTQVGEDKSGVGLGLSICRRSVEANNGVLRVRDLPECGCVFTIDLPRHSFASTPA